MGSNQERVMLGMRRLAWVLVGSAGLLMGSLRVVGCATGRADFTPDGASGAVREGGTADLNNDGFVTTDEMIALHQAGISDSDMIHRLRATQQVFALTAEQERALLRNGVSRTVVEALRGMNAELAAPHSER